MLGIVNDPSTSKFSYEAVKTTDRRKPIAAKQKEHSDIILGKTDRKKAERSTANLWENVPLAGWAIRRHLDAVSQFYFDTNDSLTDEERVRIMGLLDWHGKKWNFDAAKRHSRNSAMRLFELNNVLDGDSAMVKITQRSSARYGHLQLIEGTQIAKPKDLPPYLATMLKDGSPRITDHGLELDEWGGLKSAIICKYNKDNRQLMFQKRVLARNLIYAGYMDRYQQTRGISPLMSAINQFLDIKEGMEYILLKIKLHMLFGYAITQDAIDSADGLPSTAQIISDEDAHDEEFATEDVEREIDASKGIFGLNLNPGEDFKTIESETPPESVKDYTNLAIRIALLSLDIPYTFFDGRSSTFAHVIADHKLYNEAVAAKREKNMEVLEEYKDWKIRQWVEDGTLKGDPEKFIEGVIVKPKPSPWLDRVNEIAAAEREVALGLKSIPTLGKERGIDVYEEAREQARFLEHAEDLGVPIYIGDPGANSERDIEHDNQIRQQEVDAKNAQERENA